MKILAGLVIFLGVVLGICILVACIGITIEMTETFCRYWKDRLRGRRKQR